LPPKQAEQNDGHDRRRHIGQDRLQVLPETRKTRDQRSTACKGSSADVHSRDIAPPGSAIEGVATHRTGAAARPRRFRKSIGCRAKRRRRYDGSARSVPERKRRNRANPEMAMAVHIGRRQVQRELLARLAISPDRGRFAPIGGRRPGDESEGPRHPRRLDRLGLRNAPCLPS
jgi:hypothetical protein